MKKSTVITLLVVIVALVAVRGVQHIIKNRQKAPPGSVFVKILPEDMRAADIQKIEIYGGDAKNEAVVLSRTAAGWSVPSRFDAKGNAKNINDLLDEIKKLTGELRTKEASLHPDFDITNEKAVHIALYDKKGKLYHDLLLGKKGDRWNEGFVRLADSTKVYLADKNLRGTLGMYSEDAKPEAKKWLDLKIMDKKSEDAAKVVLDMPGKQVVLEKKEKKKEVEKKPGEGEELPAPEEKKEEKKEYEWTLVSPQTEFTFKENIAKSLVTAACQLSAVDVADPEKMNDYGFDAPTYTATLTMDDNSTETLLVGKKPEKENNRYAKLKEGKTCYLVPQYALQSVFKKMRDLVDIKIWDLNKEDVASIDLLTPNCEVLLEHRPKKDSEGKETKDYEWVLAKPQTRFELNTSPITTILSRLTKPTAEDLFVTGEAPFYGLDAPEYKAVFTMKDNSTSTLLFGKKVEGTDDRYVKFEGKDHFYSMTKYNFENVFPKLPKLLKIKIMEGLAKDDIVSLRYDTPDKDFVLTCEEGAPEAGKEKWSVKFDDEKSDAKTASVDEILDAVTAIQPEDMLLGKSETDCGLDKPEHVLAISTKKTPDQYALLVGKKVSEEGDDRYFKVKGEVETYVISSVAFRDIFKELKDVKLEKPAEPKEGKKLPAKLKPGPAPEPPPIPSVGAKPAPSTEKPPAEKEEPKESPKKEEETAAPPEKSAEKKEEAQPAAPEKEATPQPKPGPEKEEEPASPEKEKPVPPGEKPPIEIEKKDVPSAPIPKSPAPKEPVPLPSTPEKNEGK